MVTEGCLLAKVPGSILDSGLQYFGKKLKSLVALKTKELRNPVILRCLTRGKQRNGGKGVAFGSGCQAIREENICFLFQRIIKNVSK